MEQLTSADQENATLTKAPPLVVLGYECVLSCCFFTVLRLVNVWTAASGKRKSLYLGAPTCLHIMCKWCISGYMTVHCCVRVYVHVSICQIILHVNYFWQNEVALLSGLGLPMCEEWDRGENKREERRSAREWTFDIMTDDCKKSHQEMICFVFSRRWYLHHSRLHAIR